MAAELDEPAPALTRLQVAKLEALTAVWERQVRLEAPADATLLYASPKLPPVPPTAPRGGPGDGEPEPEPLPALDEAEALAATIEVTTLADPEPVHVPVGPARRVSDWSSHHDPRSLDYAVRDRLSHPTPVQTRHLLRGPVLDQGTTPPLSLREASACVGMAWAAAANVLDAETRPAAGMRDVPFLAEVDARALYARAQELDDIYGTDYPGTSVLAGAKAAQEAGWIGTYLWALLGTRDIAQAVLQLGAPVVLGVPWNAAMDTPDGAGIIVPDGPMTEGHSLTIVGLLAGLTEAQKAAADSDRVKPGAYFELQQSRGATEGAGGLVYLHHTDLAALLPGRGEACVPLPRWVS